MNASQGKVETRKRGMAVDRYLSRYGNPYDDETGSYEARDVKITDSSGNVVDTMDGAIFPKHWSVHAANTVATKYFRKDVPSCYAGRETDLRQLAGRVAKTVARWGLEQGYYEKEMQEIMEHELVAATIYQYGAFNSPVWFNLGLDSYGITQESENFYVDNNGKARRVRNFYKHPQISACFIVSPEDSIESIVEVATVLASRIFKGGSGAGSDWSAVRSSGEPISGGGASSGAIRFMDLGDSTARVIKSGGKTRRAATMQSIAVWHPDMIEVLKHKYKEEMKARILIEAGSPSAWESHTIQDLRAQNVNNSIRTDDAFWRAYENDTPYAIRAVKSGETLREESAKDIARRIAFATHSCGDPGIQNHDIINKWNTCKNSGEIWASNPCSEFNWLDRSACNLASVNLLRFRKTDGSFDLESFYKAIDMYITAQDILVSPASYPSKEVALNSHLFRPLGLGYANLGAYLMSLGLPYDSNKARNLAATITTNMTAEAYLQSTRLSESIGPFAEFEKNKEPMMEVIRMHRDAARAIPVRNGLEELLDSALTKWDEVVERGEKYGFRNSQVTLLAPTGTIGFMMDCDTTGCEPEFALKKYKELAGGGSMTIVNKTVPLALSKLGYDSNQTQEIVKYIDKNSTIEGCDTLKEEHLPVFDCAISAGEGIRVIEPMGHIRMLGALQPHLSGAISKTINCPENTGVEEIEHMFHSGWRLGIKAVAIYRDGSKAAQPVKAKRSGGLQILTRGKREILPPTREGMTQKVKLGGISFFFRTGEYEDGRLGELFIDSLQRGSEVNRLYHEIATQLSEKLQFGVPLEEAIELFGKAGKSEIFAGMSDHPFIKTAKGMEGFLYDWLNAHYLGDISFVQKEPELRPLPQELRVYQKIPKLHLIPTVAGVKFFPDTPSLEETIKEVSGENYWCDKELGLDTSETIERIKKRRIWNTEGSFVTKTKGKITGKICDLCGNAMVVDGKCWKCPSCRTSTGGCGE